MNGPLGTCNIFVGRCGLAGVNFMHVSLWQYGLWSFQTVDSKSESFLPKNQHTFVEMLNFEFWINGELSF